MTGTLSSVTHALTVLHLLRARGALRLGDIATELGVSASTAHRLVSTLREQSFVHQEAQGKRYELGPAMLFTATISALEHCVVVSEPIMQRLARSAEETVHLTVLRGTHALFAASVESRQAVRVSSRVGLEPPAHTTAGGKVLLAALGSEQLNALYRDTALAAATPVSVTDRGALFAELSDVGMHGFARNLGESEEGMYALAVPVRRPNAAVIASLTVAVPLSRMRPSTRAGYLSERERELLDQLRRAAHQIEEQLVY